MPTYEYVCEKCDNRFEVQQKITEKPLARCPKKGCKGRISRVIGGGGGFILKGSGFYATDYKKTGQPKSETKSVEKSVSSAAKADKGKKAE